MSSQRKTNNSKRDVAKPRRDRNCDIGTVAEQTDRFVEWCRARKSATDGCKNCQLNESMDVCAIEWSQMPYEGGTNE